MVLEVKIKNIYGNETIYPANKLAETFAKLLGKTTLTLQDISHIKETGIEIQVISPVVKL